MARLSLPSLPKWVWVQLDQILIPNEIGELPRLATVSVFNCERFLHLEGTIGHVVISHPIQCQQKKSQEKYRQCVGGLITLIAARQLLPWDLRVPVSSVAPLPGVEIWERAGSDLMAALQLYGIGRKPDYAALDNLRKQLNTSDYVRNRLPMVRSRAALARAVDRSVNTIDRDLMAARAANDEDPP